MKIRREDIRNIAIIAHVDHGKTTLVDCLLRQSGEFRESQLSGECILDSNELERERGITILAKNIAILYKGVKINIIDTPGHADFGGEVERVLRMADGALVLVDAAEGPMPQTRFVLSKALECGLQPLVVINKIDRPDARPPRSAGRDLRSVHRAGGRRRAGRFPYIFASGRDGYATTIRPQLGRVDATAVGPGAGKDPRPGDRRRGAAANAGTTLDWSDYVGRIAVGRIHSGAITQGRASRADARHGDRSIAGKVACGPRLRQTRPHRGRGSRRPATSWPSSGWKTSKSATRSAIAETRLALPRVEVDEPTLQMVFTHQQLAPGRPGREIRHQPASARPA